MFKLWLYEKALTDLIETCWEHSDAVLDTDICWTGISTNMRTLNTKMFKFLTYLLETLLGN